MYAIPCVLNPIATTTACVMFGKVTSLRKKKLPQVYLARIRF